MKLEEAKAKFIEAWGTLGSQWGINRTMSQIHALLLVSPEALSTETIMEQLNISRGNANMNIRALMDWGLVNKELRPGDRKEYFKAGKDMWETARKIVAERRRREIAPVLDLLSQLNTDKISGDNQAELDAFKSGVKEISDFTGKANDLVEKFVKSDQNWFYKTLLKLVK